MSDAPRRPSTKPALGSGRRPSGNDPNGRRPFIAMGVAIVILVGAWILIQHMRAASELQECQMSGRRNCGREDDPDHVGGYRSTTK